MKYYYATITFIANDRGKVWKNKVIFKCRHLNVFLGLEWREYDIKFLEAQ